MAITREYVSSVERSTLKNLRYFVYENPKLPKPFLIATFVLERDCEEFIKGYAANADLLIVEEE